MPAETKGSVYKVKGGHGIRWTENGQRHHQSPFPTKTAARQWFNENIAPRLRRGGPSNRITLNQFAGLYLDRWGRTVAPRTQTTLAKRLKPALAVFGDWTLHELEGAADDIAAWRATLTTTSRYRHTLALRQTLAAAIRWGYIQRNPAVDAGKNPEPRSEELHPFTRDEIDRLEVELGPTYGPLAVFAAETGLRTNEWVALERKDIDRSGPSVLVQRRFSGGVWTPYPKTARRRVPLTPRAAGAVDGLPVRLDTPALFPAPMGGPVDLDHFRMRNWYPALEAAGIGQRGPYCLRHTFATEALAAGVSIFELARLMGTSVKMIDGTYGHLAVESEDHLRALLSARGTTRKRRTV
jgi:integrase